ncbi:ATP synthase subunit I [Clostridium omnivorum]|uniref:ATP synthase subunit I n=1 Tax=Clostridium omnivorum TaxID=1604902 RepID=A0ABQ5N0P7_9CLOT|nr:ATP synthase subunit I [Clostridium sp. E14]GLC28756.1 hypothetical protein bsdE14_01660 [Clostridium sp. E14]
MDSEVKNMLKKVALFDVIVGSALFILVTIVYGLNYGIMCTLGLLVGALNYNINGIIINHLLSNEHFKHNIFTSLIGFLRVFIICLIAIIIYKYNRMNVLAYVLGFCSHFISLVLYGISVRNK